MRIVEDSAERLVLRDRTSWISLICWAAAAPIAIFALMHHEPKAWGSAALSLFFGVAFFRNSIVVFDKVGRSCTVKRHDIWRISRTAVRFDDIEDVLIETMIDDDPATVDCRLSLATREGHVLLSASYEPDLNRFEKMRDYVVRAVFQGRSAPASEDPVRTLVAAGRPMEAIKLLRTRENLGLVQATQRIDDLQNKIHTRRS